MSAQPGQREEIRNPILSHLNTAYIKHSLLGFPKELAKVNIRATQTLEKLTEAKRKMKMAEVILMADINSEVDPSTGKAKYTNDKARDAELMKRSATDVDCHLASIDLTEAHLDNIAAEQAKQEIQDQWEAMKKIANIVVGEMEILAKFVGSVPTINS
jgi:hypothetical protein